MGQLDSHGGHTVLPAEVDHPFQGRFVLITLAAKAFRRDAACCGNCCGFGHDQPGRTHAELTQVHQVPVDRRAALGSVLTHGRNRDAVVQGKAAKFKG